MYAKVSIDLVSDGDRHFGTYMPGEQKWERNSLEAVTRELGPDGLLRRRLCVARFLGRT
jgi:hypothetical protein